MSTITPNMGLVVPAVGTEGSPQWANELNGDLSSLDGHNHTPGNGVQIPSAGLNINADIPFSNFNATQLRSARFSIQSSPLGSPTDIGCLYVSGVDLYFNDENGNQIRITSGGSVLATSSGLSSPPASAAFIAGVLTVTQSSLTPGNISCGSILIGNNIPSSNFCTLSVPSSLGSSYALTLPTPPGLNSFMTLDSSGNMSGSVPVSAGIVKSMIFPRTIDSDIIGLGSQSPPGVDRINLVAVGQQVSATCGIFSIGSLGSGMSYTGFVPNLSVTLVTSGFRPVILLLVPTTGQSSSCVTKLSFPVSNSPVLIGITNTTLNIDMGSLDISTYSTYSSPGLPWGIQQTVMDTNVIGSPGTYTYKVAYSVGTDAVLTMQYYTLVAYEL